MEIGLGNERLIVVDRGDSLHVTYGETFKILAVPDDPSIPSNTRQGTGALSFNMLKDGKLIIFKESFHDFGPAAWDPFAKIQFFTTFFYRDGEVIVDHFFGRDLPPTAAEPIALRGRTGTVQPHHLILRMSAARIGRK